MEYLLSKNQCSCGGDCVIYLNAKVFEGKNKRYKTECMDCGNKSLIYGRLVDDDLKAFIPLRFDQLYKLLNEEEM